MSVVVEPAAEAPPPPPPPRFWAAVGEALRGSTHDFTTVPLRQAILLLAVPMVLEMAMESVFALTDIFFVGRLGSAAVAAVGLTESLLSVVYALAMGLAMGVTAVVARRIGEKDPEGAAHAAAMGILLAIGVAVVLGATGAALAPQLLALMGAPAEVVEVGVGYARIMLGGEASIILLFVVNAIFRGAGDAAIAMRTLWLANAINIVLGPLLIFGPGPLPAFGVAGAAIATTIGRSTGAAYALWRLGTAAGGGRAAGSAPRLQVARRHFRPDREVLRRLVGLASAASMQTLVSTASWIGLVRVTAGFGAAALAGYTVAIRIVVFAILPAFGMANAAATLVGQALGAKDPERARRAVWLTGHYDAVFLAALGLAFLAFAPALVGIFTRDAAVRAYGVDALRVMAVGFPLYGYGMVLVSAFNGAGDTRTPTWLNLAVFWAFEIPAAWILAHPLGMGPHGVFLAIALAFSGLAVAAGVVFRRGRWARVQV